jgi:hypothetical protein
MIDFKNPTFVKLAEVDNAVGMQMVGDFLIDDEDIFSSFKGSRDMVVFTSRRVIAVNVQGISGKKRDYSSLPYSKIQASPSRPPAPSIGTPNSSCGSADWARSGSSSTPSST